MKNTELEDVTLTEFNLLNEIANENLRGLTQQESVCQKLFDRARYHMYNMKNMAEGLYN